MKTLFRLLLLITCLLFAHTSMAQLVVVANPQSSTASLTREQTAALFLGKLTALPSGGSPIITDQPETSAIREQFYAKATEKTVALAKAGWTRLVFSGKAVRPKESANSAEVKKFVANNRDAFGYIEKSEVDGTVKVVYAVE